MLLNSPKQTPHSTLHRKSQSLLPTLSLTELQKNYYLLKAKKQNKNPQLATSKSSSNVGNEILIKSPFYDRNKCSNKISCKCEFHKKAKFQIEKKRKHQHQIKLKNSIPRLKTLADQQIPKTILSQKRLNSASDQTEYLKTKDPKYYQNLIANNQQLYREFLRRLNNQKKSDLDCYNHEFDHFLQSHEKWMLHQVRKGDFSKAASNLQKRKTNLRLQTVPSLPRNSAQFNYSQSKDLRTNFKDLKKNQKRKNKKNTDFSFDFDDENQKKYRTFASFLETLNSEDRSKLQAFMENACRQIGLDYSELKTQSIGDVNFFSTICKNLLDDNGEIVQKAQTVLRRMSRLPLELYSTIMKQMNLELMANFDPKTKSFEPKSPRMDHSVNLAFDTIQESLIQMMRNKEDQNEKEKLLILKKLKYKFVGRASLNFRSKSDSKNKFRLFDGDPSRQTQDTKLSRFANGNNSYRDSEQERSIHNQSESDRYNEESSQRLAQNLLNAKIEAASKQRRKSIKKGINMHKFKKNNIMKIIDEQIQFDNKKKPKISKKFNPILEDEYLRQRKESRKRLKEEQFNKHLEFLKQMKEKQNQRQSSTLSQCEKKQNTARAHYQRHKLFLKKMEVSLKNNDALKEVVINIEDDLFTKKRKVRILKNMINHSIPNHDSEFSKDVHKYIDIFEKNCKLVIDRYNWGNFKKYTKRKGDSLFENSYIENSSLEASPEMQSLLHMLKLDHNLKFYNVAHVQFQEEEYFSLIKEIPTFTSEKITHSVSKKQNSFINEESMSLNRKIQTDVLEQIGFENPIYPIEKIYEKCQDSEEQKSHDGIIQDESSELRKIRERFNKNMQKYQKVFQKQQFLFKQ